MSTPKDLYYLFLKHGFGVTQESAHLWHNFTCFLDLKSYKHYFSVFICESVKPTICILKTFLHLSRHMQFEITFISNGFCSLPKLLHVNFLQGLFPLVNLLSRFLNAASF